MLGTRTRNASLMPPSCYPAASRRVLTPNGTCLRPVARVPRAIMSPMRLTTQSLETTACARFRSKSLAKGGKLYIIIIAIIAIIVQHTVKILYYIRVAGNAIDPEELRSV